MTYADAEIFLPVAVSNCVLEREDLSGQLASTLMRFFSSNIDSGLLTKM